MTDKTTTKTSQPDESPSAGGYGRAVRISVWVLEFPDATQPERLVADWERRKIAWASEEDALEFLDQVRSERAEALSKLREA